MGIEPTWGSLHYPTPDLKSGSPTSELGTSGRFITKMANHVEEFKASRLCREVKRLVALSHVLIYDCSWFFPSVKIHDTECNRA